MICFGGLFDLDDEVAGAQMIWNQQFAIMMGASRGTFQPYVLKNAFHLF